MRKTMLICGLLILSCLFGYRISAEEITQTIELYLTASDQFQLELKAGAGGNVYDGEARIRQGSITFDLAIDAKKEFQILPDKGYHIKHIWYQVPGYQSARDITDDIIDDTLYVKCVSADAKLEIEFARDSGAEVLKTGSSHAANTGDTQEQGTILAVVLISGFGCIVLIGFRKRNKDSYDPLK